MELVRYAGVELGCGGEIGQALYLVALPKLGNAPAME